MRACSIALTLLLGGCVYFSKHTVQGACARDLGSPIRNFCVASPGILWRGERPTASDAAWLLQHQVGSIVNLELFRDDHRAFEAAPAPNDITVVEYYHVADFEPVHLLNWSLLDDHVAHFLAIVATAQLPVYLHCLDGIDRSSVLIGAYRVLMEGQSAEQALREMGQFRSPWLRVDARYIRSLAVRQRQILARKAEWQARLRPDARIECAQARCSYLTAGQLRSHGERD